MKSQSGTKTVDEVGRFPGLRDEVWLDVTGPMNVVSFGLLQAQYRMTYDNSHSNGFLIHRDANSFRSFDMVAAELYICNLSE